MYRTGVSLRICSPYTELQTRVRYRQQTVRLRRRIVDVVLVRVEKTVDSVLSRARPRDLIGFSPCPWPFAFAKSTVKPYQPPGPASRPMPVFIYTGYPVCSSSPGQEEELLRQHATRPRTRAPPPCPPPGSSWRARCPGQARTSRSGMH